MLMNGRSAVAAVLVLIVGIAVAPCAAQLASDAAAGPPPGRDRQLTVPVADKPPVIDGDLSDPAWRSAARADGFWISEQQRRPTEPTVVLVTADSRHLYIAFECLDSDPSAIEALQTRRDADLGYDDQVVVELDPQMTHRQISRFAVNAAGVQTDSYGAGRARQGGWRGDWQAATRRTAWGWVAEIAIPFAVLDFAGAETVAVNFVRHHRRSGEWSRWADVTVRALPERMGRLTGLRPAVGAAAAEQPLTLMPYLMVGRRVPDRDGVVRDTLVSAGADIRIRPRPQVTGIVSLHPDFSQVERAVASADFSYNETARADPRPFFQEGGVHFGNSDERLRRYFYSNRIPDFDVGAKVFGRAGATQFGAFATRSRNERSDAVATLRHPIAPTQSIGAMVVATERPGLRGVLAAVQATGREPSGFDLAFDAATSRVDPGDTGNYARAAAGWQRGPWSVGTAVDRYSSAFAAPDGLLPRDLPDTAAWRHQLGYYRDRADSALRVVQADLSWDERRTGDGRVQRRTAYAGASVEWRDPQVRFGAAHSAGPYRPVGAGGGWRASVNDDRYSQLSADFDTRSSRVGYGVTYAWGELGGGDYRHRNAYLWSRPTATLTLNVSAERLENFGVQHQTVVGARWDATPQHAVSARLIDASYGRSARLLWTWLPRRNVEVIALIDHEPGRPLQVSTKLLGTFP